MLHGEDVEELLNHEWSAQTMLPEYFPGYSAKCPIVIKSYDPIWPIQFQKLKADLEADLAEGKVTYLRIEHIGSTSVPGLGSKATTDPSSDCWLEAVIDICIVIQRQDFHARKLAEFQDALLWGQKQGGYFYIGDGGVGMYSLDIACL